MSADMGVPSFLKNYKDMQAAQNPALPLAGKGQAKMTEKKADGIAKEFESMFLSQMLAPMWEGVATDSLFGGGSAEETYRGMMINEYGNLISKAGGLGIAADVKAELLKTQEIPHAHAKL